MKFHIITIFPQFFDSFKNFSLINKGIQKGVLNIEVYNLRDFSTDNSRHRVIDHKPYGGGAGMLFMIEPMYRAIKHITQNIYYEHGLQNNSEIPEENITSTDNMKRASTKPHIVRVVLFTPKGQTLKQTLCRKLVRQVQDREKKYGEQHFILICPHYEGVDERILNFVDLPISIGDYILTGGELPAMIFIDSLVRLKKGFVGNDNSVIEETFSKSKFSGRSLEYPQYTKPEIFIDDDGNKYKVPDVLLSGNHKDIEEWRQKNILIK